MRLRGRILRLGLAGALVVSLALSAASEARVAPTPVLGDWEGVGPHGLPLSFTLVRTSVSIAGRTHRIVVIRNLVVSYPAACADVPDNSQAFAYPTASYTGPGAPPVTFRFRNARRFDVYIGPAPGFDIGLGFVMQGSWSSAKRGVLSAPAIQNGLRRCGWPKKTLTWRLLPAGRVKIAPGTWSGTVSGPDGVSGSVAATVGKTGRTVDRFHLSYTCSNGGSSNLDFTPAFELAHRPTSLFVSAGGSFSGTRAIVNGIQIHWSGTFGSDGTLRGTFTDLDACNGSNGALAGTFTGRHQS